MPKITDVAKAHGIVTELITNDQIRARKRVKISGMIDGNPPYDPKKMKATGRGHECNVNFREAEGMIKARNGTLYELFLDGESVVNCRLKDPNQYQGRSGLWEATVIEKSTEMLRDWPRFIYEMMSKASSINKWGSGFMFWPDKHTWKPKALNTGEVLFPKDTKANVEYIDCCGIIDTISVSELLAKSKTDLENNPWNKDAAALAIKNALDKALATDTEWEELQRDIENNAMSYEASITGRIKIIHLLVKEDDGKVSHYIMERGKTNDPFLYKVEGSHDSVQSVLVPFVCDIGNGYFHSLKGVGHRIFASVLINNRFLCKAVNGAMDSTSMVISFQDGTNRKGKLLRLGSTIYLPPGAGLEQNHMERNLQGVTQMHSMLSQVNQTNVGIQRPGLSLAAQDDKAKNTARGESIAAQKEVKLEKVDVALYYSQEDLFYKELMRRIFSSSESEAVAFRKACTDNGVPAKLLEFDRWTFKAPRVIGAGSGVMKHLYTQENLSIAPYCPEEGQHNLIEDFIEARGGHHAVKRYLPTYNEDARPTMSHQMAQLENNDLVQGQGCIVGMENWHATHAKSHLDYFEPYAQSIIQAQDQQQLPAAVSALSVALDHIGNHLAYLQGDDLFAQQYAGLEKRLKAFVGVVKQIQAAYQAMMKQQQAQQQEQAEAQQEMIEKGDQTELQKFAMELKADQELKVLKEQNNHGVRVAKMENSINIANATAEANLERIRAQTAASAGRG